MMDNSDKKKTPIGELGKYGLIDQITRSFNLENKSSIAGKGDDAAIIDSGSFLTLVSTDLLLEGIHFNLIYNPLKHLGYKTVIRGISDIYAMNGVASQILISLGISSRFSVEQIEEIYEGIAMACSKYKVDLVGGDTTSSLTGLTLGITALGSVGKDNVVKRDGARANDLICVTGDFGASFMGLQLLERERRLFDKEKVTQPDLAGNDYVIARQLKPELPVKVLADLRTAEIKATSMIDVTEGLSSDLLQICRSSRTGCRIFSGKIPIDYETSRLAEEFNINPIIPALNGGEDYEFVFTVSLEMFEKIKLVDSVKVIGHMTSEDSGYKLVDDGGAEIDISAEGWQQQK